MAFKGTQSSHQSPWQKELQRNPFPKITLNPNTSEATTSARRIDLNKKLS